MTTLTPIGKLPATIVIIGSILFLIAAFMPISFVYAERDVLKQIAYVESRPSAWAISLILFALGSVLTAVGLALLTLRLRDTSAAFSGYLGLAMVAIATLCWIAILYRRATLPLPEVFQSPTFGWLFIVYTLLIQAALIAYGFTLLRAGYPRWMWLGAIIPAVLLCAAYLIFKDVPPFAYYVIALAMGIGLLL